MGLFLLLYFCSIGLHVYFYTNAMLQLLFLAWVSQIAEGYFYPYSGFYYFFFKKASMSRVEQEFSYLSLYISFEGTAAISSLNLNSFVINFQL